MSAMESWIVLIFIVAATVAVLTRLAEMGGGAFADPLRIASRPASALRALWRRAMQEERPLRLSALAAGLGVADLADPSSDVSIRSAARAARRCVFCSRHSRCDAHLAARDWKAVAAICPNAGYLERLRAQPRR